MIKILALICCSLFMNQPVNGQKTDTAMNISPQALHDKYIQNSKTQNTIGWIALGSGIGLTAGGIYTYVIQAMGEGSVTNTGPTLFYLGATAALTSIPFFISAGKYKGKAKLALKGESVTMGNKILHKSGYTALALTIAL